MIEKMDVGWITFDCAWWDVAMMSLLQQKTNRSRNCLTLSVTGGAD
jgi:hypothetical protein